MIEIYKEIIKIKSNGGKAALATIISTKGSTPREVSAKMLIRSDSTVIGSIGGGNVEAIVCKEAKKVVDGGKPEIMHFDLTGKNDVEIGMVCGGMMDVFIEPILSPPILYIFGGGNISFTLVRIAKMVDFKVVVIDDRKDFATIERFPEADKVIHKNFKKIFEEIQIDKSCFIVIVTTCHKKDEQVLEKVIKTPTRYVGMIGSQNKKEIILSNLLDRGISQKLLDRVHTPSGLEIEAETPEEIAVSIVAEMIKVRNT